MQIPNIIKEVPFFDNIEKKEKLIFVIGALITRLISLEKAAEIIGISKEVFLEILGSENLDGEKKTLDVFSPRLYTLTNWSRVMSEEYFSLNLATLA